MSNLLNNNTHYTGPEIDVDGLLRMRCAWCGTKLFETQLPTGNGGPVQDSPFPPPGIFVKFSDLEIMPISVPPGQIPADSCMRLDNLFTN